MSLLVLRLVRVPLAGFLLATSQLATAQSPVSGLPFTETALLGRFERGPIDLPVRVTAADFGAVFGSANPVQWPSEAQARQFFANGGYALQVVRIASDIPLVEALLGDAQSLRGLHALTPISDLRALIAPELSRLPTSSFVSTLAAFRSFLEPRGVFFILDPPPEIAGVNQMVEWVDAFVPNDSGYCSLYFPYLKVKFGGASAVIGASGAMAAIYGSFDNNFGIWASPAGTRSPNLSGATLSIAIASDESDLLTAHGISPIRAFAGTGVIPWGARTLDRVNPDNRYISTVRTRGWIASSIERGLAFTSARANDAALWTEIRQAVENYLVVLWRDGALVGTTPSQAYFVRCDATTTSAAEIAAHRVNLQYGLAMARPAEFVVNRVTLPTYDPNRELPPISIHAALWQNRLNLSYPLERGARYVLEHNAELRNEGWIATDPPSVGDGSWYRASLPILPGNQLYRARALPLR